MILTDHEIRIAAQQWVSITDAPNPNATSFAAGAKFVLQKLQQCNCSVLREVLVQRLGHIQKLQFGMDEITAAKYEAQESTLQSVIEMMGELPPVA